MVEAEMTEQDAAKRMAEAIDALSEVTPTHSAGRGIVICGGGLKYFTCAWVCIRMLRQLGCKLPIELWHFGRREITDASRAAVERHGVQCVDVMAVRERHPARILNGWEVKPYSIIHSRYEEVLLLDADNVPVVDPTFLFDTPEYQQTGAIFWPDFGRLGRDRAIWRLSGVPYRNEPEFETGQIVVDKARCAKALQLTMWMNEHSDFWYRHIHGDKETFHIAWRKLNQAYSMPSRGIHALDGTMCQHDFQGRRIFQHRNLKKWSLGRNPRVAGFEHEEQCLRFVEELRPLRRELLGFPPFNRQSSSGLADRRVVYRRVGFDERILSFKADGDIGEGQDRMERCWGVSSQAHQEILEILGDDGVTARLVRDALQGNRWCGKWVIHEQMPVEITVLDAV